MKSEATINEQFKTIQKEAKRGYAAYVADINSGFNVDTKEGLENAIQKNQNEYKRIKQADDALAAGVKVWLQYDYVLQAILKNIDSLQEKLKQFGTSIEESAEAIRAEIDKTLESARTWIGEQVPRKEAIINTLLDVSLGYMTPLAQIRAFTGVVSKVLTPDELNAMKRAAGLSQKDAFKVPGLEDAEKKLLETIARWDASMSPDVKTATARLVALLPSTITVDLKGAKGVSKTKDGEVKSTGNLRVIDALRQSIFENLTMAPEVAKKINFIGTNEAQAERLIRKHAEWLAENDPKLTKMQGTKKDRVNYAINILSGSKMDFDKSPYISETAKLNFAHWFALMEDRQPQKITETVVAYSDPWDGALYPGCNPQTNGVIFINKTKRHIVTDEEVDEFRRASEASKFHPSGSIRSTYDHEFAHKIDEILNLNNDPEFLAIMKPFWKDPNKFPQTVADMNIPKTREALSEYAANGRPAFEFIAEAWAEYMNDPDGAREVAKKVGELIERKLGMKVPRKSH